MPERLGESCLIGIITLSEKGISAKVLIEGLAKEGGLFQHQGISGVGAGGWWERSFVGLFPRQCFL
ncbi:MAG: hypothetical protein P1P77_18355 [Spirochaetaceae bacterium]|nr:hypothetical protein [Spirochaetaceae bacterium]